MALTTKQKAQIATAKTTKEKADIALGKAQTPQAQTPQSQTPPAPLNRGEKSQSQPLGSYVNSKGQRIYEGDANYNPNQDGASNFYNNPDVDDSKFTQNYKPPEQETPQPPLTGGLSDAQKQTYETQIAEAQKQTKLAEEAKKQSFAANQRLLDQQEAALSQIDARFGDLGNQIRQIVGGVEQQTGKQVMIDDGFVQSAQKLQEQFADDPEKLQYFLRQLAENRAARGGELAAGEGLQTPPAPLNRGEESQAQASVDGMQGQGQVVETLPSGTEVLSGFNPNGALNQAISAMMNDPNATSEEILLGTMLSAQLDQSSKSAQRIEDYLMRSAERTKQHYDNYSAMLTEQKAQLTDYVQQQADMANRRYTDQEQRLLSEKAETMEDLTEKRSRLEGYLKAKLKAQGVLDSSFGINKLVTGVTKFDALMVDTAEGYNQQIKELATARDETLLGFVGKTIEINQAFQSGILSLEEKRMEKQDSLDLMLTESINSREANDLLAVSDYGKEVMRMRAEKKEKEQAALEAARKELNEKAKWFTEQTGVIYTLENDEIVMMTDENGEPMKSWARVKEENSDLWEREKFGATFGLQSAQFGLQEDRFALDYQQYQQGRADKTFGDMPQIPDGFKKFQEYRAKTEYSLGLALSRGQISQKEYQAAILELDALEQQEVVRDQIFKETGDLNEEVITTDIDNVYGSKVKLVPTVAAKVGIAQNILNNMGIELKIGDSHRSTATQAAAYHSGKEGVAPPGTSFHEIGQAIDLSQRGKDGMNDPRVFAALEAAGLKQHPNEWWHWSYGEFDRGGGGDMTATEKILVQDLVENRLGQRAAANPDVLSQWEEAFMSNGRDIDSLEDMLRQSKYSGSLTVPYLNALDSIGIDMTQEKRTNLENVLDRMLQDGDETGAKDLVKKAARDATDVGTAARVNGWDRTAGFLGELEGKLEEFEANGGDTGIFVGTNEKIQQKLGRTSNPKLAALGNEIWATVQQYRRDMSGAAFSVPESEEYKAMFPSIQNNLNLNKSLLQSLKGVMEYNSEHFYRQSIGTGAYEELFKNGTASSGWSPTDADMDWFQNIPEEEEKRWYDKISLTT